MRRRSTPATRSAIAEVVRDLHRNAGQPDQSFSERQIYESAMDRLAAEYAALEKLDKPTADRTPDRPSEVGLRQAVLFLKKKNQKDFFYLGHRS